MQTLIVIVYVLLFLALVPDSNVLVLGSCMGRMHICAKIEDGFDFVILMFQGSYFFIRKSWQTELCTEGNINS